MPDFFTSTPSVVVVEFTNCDLQRTSATMQYAPPSISPPRIDRISPRRVPLAGGLVTLTGIGFDTQHFFEAALVVALLGFISTVALAKYIVRGDIIE